MDQTERHAEWNLDAVEHQEEPRAGADQFQLGQCDRQKIEGHDRSSGIGQHRGDSCEQSHTPRKPELMRHKLKLQMLNKQVFKLMP